jgi:(2R)-3-sulfolactate dehydrogenase (NADP+)
MRKAEGGLFSPRRRGVNLSIWKGFIQRRRKARGYAAAWAPPVRARAAARHTVNQRKRTMNISLEDARQLGEGILVRHKVSEQNAVPTIAALLRAEMEGIPSHGFSRIPYYVGQADTGKVDGRADPLVSRPRPGVVRVDACCGFAFRAFAAGLPELAAAAKAQGIALMGVCNSHHAGVLGFPVADLAAQGLLALGFANSPASLAPYGGRKGVFGTNPLAMACPRKDAPPLVIDLSMGLLARGKVLQAAKKGELIPEGAARDAEGNPTRDAAKAFDGALLPFGGPKGYALALMVEILAGVLPGAAWLLRFSLFTPDGPAPLSGQSFVAIDPGSLAGADFADRLELLLGAITAQPGARLPGDRRIRLREAAQAAGSISLPDELCAQLHALE